MRCPSLSDTDVKGSPRASRYRHRTCVTGSCALHCKGFFPLSILSPPKPFVSRCWLRSQSEDEVYNSSGSSDTSSTAVSLLRHTESLLCGVICALLFQSPRLCRNLVKQYRQGEKPAPPAPAPPLEVIAQPPLQSAIYGGFHHFLTDYSWKGTRSMGKRGRRF